MISTRKMSIGVMTKVSILSVIAFVIMFIETPVFVFPGFLKLDLSDVPALVAGFAMGPVAGILVELLKNLMHLLRTSTGGVGEIANFVIGSAFVVPAAIIYYKNKTKKNAVIGLIIGTIVMAIVGSFANYFVLIPFYQNFMPIDAIIAMSAKANSAIVDMKTLILYGILPFNIFKGIIVSLFTLGIYKKISGILQ